MVHLPAGSLQLLRSWGQAGVAPGKLRELLGPALQHADRVRCAGVHLVGSLEEAIAMVGWLGDAKGDGAC